MLTDLQVRRREVDNDERLFFDNHLSWGDPDGSSKTHAVLINDRLADATLRMRSSLIESSGLVDGELVSLSYFGRLHSTVLLGPQSSRVE